MKFILKFIHDASEEPGCSSIGRARRRGLRRRNSGDDVAAQPAIDAAQVEANLAKLRSAPELPAKVAQAFAREFESADLTDPDEQLYAGGFIGDTDRQKLNWLLSQPVESLGEQEIRFEDARLPEMVFRYRARNYPSTLSGEEMERWEHFRTERLMRPGKGWRSLEDYGRELQRLAADPALTPEKRHILEELHLYGESLMPYL